MGISDGLLAAVMLLAMWGICAAALRLGIWWMNWLDRRDAAAFRAQVMLAEAEIARRSSRREFDGDARP